jgi:hypothetical protein
MAVGIQHSICNTPIQNKKLTNSIMNNTITSVANFVERINKIKTDNDHEMFFRGCCEHFPNMLPQLYCVEKNRFWENEDNFYYDAIAQYPQEFANCKTIDVLVKMRHYEFPTRLLDITTNALVALFFACGGDKSNEDDNKKDGEVIVLKIPKKAEKEDYGRERSNIISHYDSDRITILANLAKQKASFDYRNDKDKDYLTYACRADISYFHHMSEFPSVEKDIKKVYVFIAKMDNPRIIRQQGAFLIFGVKNEKKYCADIDKTWINTKVDIPAQYKKDILKELKNCGITKYFLFPELDKFAEYLKGKYDAGTQNTAVNSCNFLMDLLKQ